MANPVEITKQVLPTSSLHSGTLNTGTANVASVLNSGVVDLRYGVILRTPGTGEPNLNTDEVYIGDSAVSVTNGWALRPGDTLELKIDDLSKLYAFSAAANQSVQWIGY